MSGAARCGRNEAAQGLPLKTYAGGDGSFGRQLWTRTAERTMAVSRRMAGAATAAATAGAAVVVGAAGAVGAVGAATALSGMAPAGGVVPCVAAVAGVHIPTHFEVVVFMTALKELCAAARAA